MYPFVPVCPFLSNSAPLILNFYYYRLEWELDGFQADLKEARENLEGMIADSDLLVATPSYGKRIPKKCHLSPDGWFQVRVLTLSFEKQ